MPPRLRVEADLAFSVGRSGPDPLGGTASGTLTGDGSHLVLRSDDLETLSVGGGGAAVPVLAGELARIGLSLSIVGPHGAVVTIGDVRSGLLHRLLTRSRHVRVEHWRRAWEMRQAQRRALRSGSPGGADVVHLPPPTPLPLAPTFRHLRRPVTTTHDPLGGGRPQLVLAMGPAPVAGATRKVFRLRPQGTSIGSAADVDLRLEGLQPLHARVVRDDDDEYVLVALASDGTTLVNGARVDRKVLRSGTHIQLGSWRMTYWREEFADHGRPYGGREGGEFSRQRSQSRPTYRPR